MNERAISIAIDGPAGAGKSTIAMLVARRFGLSYVDTGAMYRGVALLAVRASAALDDEAALAALARDANFSFAMDAGGELRNRAYLNEEEVTGDIRVPEISKLASPVSAFSAVRRELVAKQKLMGEAGGVVMEGRDIGTVVLPKAEVKIFLTASPEERARRRFLELKQKGISAQLETVLSDIVERDRRDTTRADSPLRPADDSATVDTDGLGIGQVVDRICEVVFEKTGVRPSV
ncbi:MAG TPA: (d)CMP kinase [bacterium]|nr:(d)CMP kinase [bacterium]